MAGNVLDIESLLGKAKNRIVKAGIELEGAWIAPVPKDHPIQPDGSVKFPSSYVLKDGANVTISKGEIVSSPLQPIQVPAWIRKNYPYAVNDTCGLHAHMSFENLYQYDLLMDTPDYQATMIEYITRWAKKEEFPSKANIWKRLKGEHKSEHGFQCTLDFWPGLQAQKHKKVYDHGEIGSRYTAINYCYGQHTTLECRVLPMCGNVEQAIRGVRVVFDVTNAVLAKLGKTRTKKVKVDIDGGAESLYEEYVKVII